jgi:hypothetical protein
VPEVLGDGLELFSARMFTTEEKKGSKQAALLVATS